MKLKKIIAATMVGALSVATVPLIAPTPVDHVLTAQAEAAKGGARISPKATPKAAPKASEGQSSSGKSVSGNGNSYAPSKQIARRMRQTPRTLLRAARAGGIPCATSASSQAA